MNSTRIQQIYTLFPAQRKRKSVWYRLRGQQVRKQWIPIWDYLMAEWESNYTVKLRTTTSSLLQSHEFGKESSQEWCMYLLGRAQWPFLFRKLKKEQQVILQTHQITRQLPKAEVITLQKKSLVTSFLRFESSPLSRETISSHATISIQSISFGIYVYWICSISCVSYKKHSIFLNICSSSASSLQFALTEPFL